VNPGNSGGPLINMQGEVIGINSQIYSRTGGFMGISFAIPIDEAMRVADQLKATGKVTRGRIAWRSARSRRTWPIRSGCRSERRAGGSVEPGGPADKAGIEPGDIILKFNGRRSTRRRTCRAWSATRSPARRRPSRVAQGPGARAADHDRRDAGGDDGEGRAAQERAAEAAPGESPA
jgi:S1-C subfamily serine protease